MKLLNTAIFVDQSDKPKRRGRPARTAPVTVPNVMKRTTPVYDLLDEEALIKLESHADWILQEIGIEFCGDPETLRLFKEAGASVKEDSIAMARFVFGDAFLDAHCVIQGYINVNSPPTYDETMTGALRTCPERI